MRVARILLCVVMGAAGLALAARAFLGPLDSPIPIHSPLNAEGWFAVAAVVLIAVDRWDQQRPVGNRPQVGNLPYIASLVVLIAGMFGRAANSYFLSDDFLIVPYANEYHFAFRQFTTAGGDGFFRPAGNLGLALTALWAHYDPLRWHLSGFTLHAANTLLVFALARQLDLDRVSAWFAAAVFAVHGSRPEAVVWVAGRFDLQVTFFALLALLMYLRSRTYAALAAMMLAILSKESGYAIPALIALMPPPRSTRWKLSAPFFAVAAVLFAYRFALFGNAGGYLDASGNPEIFLFNPLSIVRTLAFRIWAILFFPINWSWQPQFWLSAAMVAFLGAIAWVAWRARPPGAGLPIAFVIAASIPALQQMLIGADLEKSRQLYLPSIGFALLLGVLGQNLRARPALYAAILGFQAAALWHNIDLWKYAAAKSRPACAAAAACARQSGRALIIGMPRSLNGVYFFANGFPTCVESELGAPAQIEMRTTDPQQEGNACTLSWDSATDTLKRR